MNTMALNFEGSRVPRWADMRAPSLDALGLKIRKPILKPMAKTLDWAKLVKGDLPKPTKAARKLLSRISDGLSCLELPRKCRKLIGSLTSARFGSSIGEKAVGSVGVFNHFTSIVGLGATGLEILHEERVLTFSARHMMILNAIGLMGSIALILKSIVDIKEIFNELNHLKSWEPAFNSSFITIVQKICKLVIGIFGVVFFLATGTLATQYTLLSLSSIALALSITKYYYNRIVI